MNTCKFCGKNSPTRIGGCFQCAEAESIIDEGTDMYDNGLDGKQVPAISASDKLRLLIQKGWVFQPNKKLNEVVTI